MTIPARTIRELGELTGASRATDIAAILNIHQSKLPPLTGMRRHVYTTEDCYPAAFGRLAVMARDLLNERDEHLARITELEAELAAVKLTAVKTLDLAGQYVGELEARLRPVYVPPADDALLAEFEAVTAGDYPERHRG